MLLVRAANLRMDAGWIYELWSRELDPRWSLSPGALRRQLTQCVCLVAEWCGAPAGFCAGTYQAPGTAALTALLVSGAHRRRGIASGLLQCLEARLRSLGAETLRLGCGASSTYFWPGVPISNPSVWGFFASRGWAAEDTVSDLAASLSELEPRITLDRFLATANYRFALASTATHKRIEAFEALHFPVWAEPFRTKLTGRRFHEVLIAYASDDSIAGSVLLEDNQSVVWRRSLGSGCFSMSALGVASDHRRKGLGQALVAYAFTIAKGRGATKCYVNWTGLTDWYSRLGARSWAEYTMSEKRLR